MFKFTQLDRDVAFFFYKRKKQTKFLPGPSPGFFLFPSYTGKLGNPSPLTRFLHGNGTRQGGATIESECLWP